VDSGHTEEECVKEVVEAIRADALEGVVDVDKVGDLIERLESDDFLEMMCAGEIEFLQNLLLNMESPVQGDESWVDQVVADLDLAATPNFSIGGLLWECSSDENDSDDSDDQ
jgi:hypothetical protein